MIVYTKQGQRELMPNLAAYSGGVYVYPFLEDEPYTDPHDSSIWTWFGVESPVEEILGVSQSGDPLIVTNSISDCVTLPGSFFWDDANSYLYVHWFYSIGDWSVAKEENRYSKIVNGFASQYGGQTSNVFDGQYYDSIIISLTGLDVTVDPTKLGLIGFNNSTLTLADEENVFASVNKEDIVGVPIWTYFVNDDTIELENKDRIFTGVLNGIKHNRSSVTFDIIQSRLFENRPVCQNTITLEEWPNAESQEGKLKPTAWGSIRRGKVVPVNLGSLETDTSGSAILLLADSDFSSLLAISKIYDDEDNEITIDSFSLTDCTATITKPAGMSVSRLKKFKWEGEGYSIVGTYNNGLDIIKDAFLKVSKIPFLDSTYDVGQWNRQTIENPEPVGISIQSDKGFVEELIEPIMTSLQGVVQTLGDGRISFFNRDTDVDFSEEIFSYNQTADPTIEETTKELVSEIVVEYSKDFVEKESLQIVYTDNSVVGKYGVDTRDPISPVKTLLSVESDAISIAEEIAETSTDPQRIITVIKNTINKNINIFDVVCIDTGEYAEEHIEYGEILSIRPDYIAQTQTYTIRIIPDYVPQQSIPGFEHSTGTLNFIAHGIDGHGVFDIRRN